jgi:hypothetical protein
MSGGIIRGSVFCADDGGNDKAAGEKEDRSCSTERVAVSDLTQDHA